MAKPCRPSFILQLCSCETRPRMVSSDAVQPDGGRGLEEKQHRSPCHMRSSRQPMCERATIVSIFVFESANSKSK